MGIKKWLTLIVFIKKKKREHFIIIIFFCITMIINAKWPFQMICSDNFDNHMGEGRQLIATDVANKGVDIFTFCTFFFFCL